MVVRMLVVVRVVMVMRVFMFMKMLLLQSIHAYRHLSYFVFYKISRWLVSLPGG